LKASLELGILVPKETIFIYINTYLLSALYISLSSNSLESNGEFPIFNALDLNRSSGEEGGSRAGRRLLQYTGGAPFNIVTHMNKKMDFLVAHLLYVIKVVCVLARPVDLRTRPTRKYRVYSSIFEHIQGNFKEY
jgi:hypothetical protein